MSISKNNFKSDKCCNERDGNPYVENQYSQGFVPIDIEEGSLVTIEPVIDSESVHVPLEVSFKTVYPWWVRTGNGALEAMENGEAKNLSSYFCSLNSMSSLMDNLSKLTDEKELLVDLFNRRSFYDRFEGSVRNIAYSLFDGCNLPFIGDDEKFVFLKSMISSRFPLDVSLKPVYDRAGYDSTCRFGTANGELQACLSKDGLPLVVAGDQIVYSFRDRKLFKYKGHVFDLANFCNAYYVSVRNDSHCGNYLDVMLKGNFSPDSLLLFSRQFVNQFLKEKDTVYFTKEYEDFDYLTDLYMPISKKGECIVADLFGDILNKSDFPLDNSGKTVFLTLEPDTLTLEFTTTGRNSDCVFSIRADKEVFPSCEIRFRDARQCYLDKQSRERRKKYGKMSF